MKRPGDTGRHGYPIESLAIDAQATMADARGLLADGQETTETVDRQSDAAINLLDARRNDVFLWDSGPIPAEQRECDSSADAASFGLQRVVATSEISEFAFGGYVRLVRDWLRELAPKAPSEDGSDDRPAENRTWGLAFQAVAATVESTAIERVTVR